MRIRKRIVQEDSKIPTILVVDAEDKNRYMNIY